MTESGSTACTECIVLLRFDSNNAMLHGGLTVLPFSTYGFSFWSYTVLFSTLRLAS